MCRWALLLYNLSASIGLVPDLVSQAPGVRLNDRSHGLGEEVSMLEERLVDGDHHKDAQNADNAEAENQAGI